MRFDRNEIGGSLGDLGTFLVFLVGTAAISGMNPSAFLLFAGLFNIATGLAFGVPMAVQPMKAIGVIAISNRLTSTEIVAAGVIMGLVVLALSATSTLSRAMKYVPRSVVRGIQLGLGLMFMKLGVELVASTNSILGLDSYLTAIVACAIAFLLFDNRRIPSAVIIFAIGALIAIVRPGSFHFSEPTLYLPSLMIPSLQSFVMASWLLVIPQLPLTIVNSLIATISLAHDYFPAASKKLTIDKVGLSVGVMNVIGCPFGAMPMCHGAGGLAAQYRFGARTGGSVVFLGLAKVLFGLLLGSAVLSFSKSFPLSVLGAMMIFGGVELATHMKDITEYRDVFVMVLVAGISLVTNVGLGFIIGLILAHYWKFNKTNGIRRG